MTATLSIQLYQILQEHFGKSENAAKAVSAIEEMIEDRTQAGSTHYEEIVYKDIQLLRTDMDSGLKLVRTEVHRDIEVLRAEVRKDIELLRADLDKKLELLRGSLETKIAETSAGSLRWVFSFFIALSLMIIGLYLKK